MTAARHGWDVDDRSTEQRHSELSCRLDRVVGGLELSVKFAHSDDRERVLDAARGVGWTSVHDVEHRDWCDAGLSSLHIDSLFLFDQISLLNSASGVKGIGIVVLAK